MEKFKQNKYLVEDVETIFCPYCNHKSEKMLHWKHLKVFHDKTMDDVQREFPNHTTMTLNEFNRRCSFAKKGQEKSKEVLESKKYKKVKCYYCEDDDCPGEKYGVEIWAPNYIICDHCKRMGKENPDRRFKEEANKKRIRTFQKRYGEKIKNSRDLLDTDYKIKATSDKKYGGIGRASKFLNEKYEEGMIRNHNIDNPMRSEKLKNKDLKCSKCGEVKRVAINYKNELCPECKNEKFPGMLEIDDNRVVCQICWKGFGRIYILNILKPII